VHATNGISATNNLIQNIAVIPDIVFQFLTFDTNGQHSSWLYDKKTTVILSLHIFRKIVLYQSLAYGV
jgi:hypothetical protein